MNIVQDASWLDRFRRGRAVHRDDELRVGDTICMYEWERPLMRAFAQRLCPCESLLEVGFGMGIFAAEAQALGPARHTIIEVHPELAAAAELWASGCPSPPEVIEAPWQDCIADLGRYDAIFYDSFAPDHTLLGELETFVGISARALLRPGGRLGIWYKTPALACEIQNFLLQHFDRLEVEMVRDLNPTKAALERGFGTSMPVWIASRPLHAGGGAGNDR